jgi:enoyl-CoA hydratase/carnithine racemase
MCFEYEECHGELTRTRERSGLNLFMGTRHCFEYRRIGERMSDFEFISYQCDSDGIALITLDRSEHLNTMSLEMIKELCRAFDRADADPTVRVIILTGAGRAFCGGADLSKGADVLSPAKMEGGLAASERDSGGVLVLRIFSLTKPIIAAVNGASAGIGATMILPCDIRIASSSAKFGFVFTRRGIVTDGCASWFLPRLVGIGTALRWCLGGGIIKAEEALAAGLISAVCEPESLLSEARNIAKDIALNTSAVAVSLTRQLLWQGLVESHPMDSHRFETFAIEYTSSSEDAKEGIISFFEKRQAEFTSIVPKDLPNGWPLWKDPDY